MTGGTCEHISLVLEALRLSGTCLTCYSDHYDLTLDCDTCQMFVYTWKYEGKE